MILRTWKGWTTRENAPLYESLFKDTVLPQVTRGVTGYKGVNLLRREVGAEIEFTTLFWFESVEAVRSFAGEDFERAVVPDQVKQLMCRYDENVSHHDVAL